MSAHAERDLDPHRNTVPRADDMYVMSADLATGALSARPAKQEDLRHCASCTCPPEPYPPVEVETCKACHGRKQRLHGWAVCPAPCRDCNGTGQVIRPAGGES